jgi:hypothetical protein
MVVGLTGLAQPAAADPIPTLPIVVQIPDDRHVSVNVVSRAQDEVTRIYRAAGVHVVWIAGSSTGTSDPGFTLIVLPRPIPHELTTATEPVAADALGVAVGTREHRGRVAYVFYDRVESIVRTRMNMSRQLGMDDMYNATLLGHAMAHEIGHLLLPYGHSATGLMSANWDAKGMRLIVKGCLYFTSDQAELIRGQLLAPIAR